MPAAECGDGEGEGGVTVSQQEASRMGRERLVLPSLKVSRETLRSFPHSKRVGSYLVGKMINRGSFAKVMEGLHMSTGEKVAIKVIDKKKARQDSYVLKNMKREPRIHQLVRHPHIVVLLETLETENSYYMAMELCAGGDLMDRICERKRLEEREVRRYTRQILSAVEHLHTHGIVHRDLKIENFLLDEHNNIKIVDFGLSNTLKVDSVSADLLTTQCGSPAYAAPELLAHKKYGPKVDVWSVGVSTFAMLTGTLPFTVEPFNIKQLHQKMVNGEIGTIPNDISKGAVGFVLFLLEPEPSKRPSIRAAMEEKWVNEGYNKRPLHTLIHRNRLRPEDLNQSALSYMTESLGYSLTEVITTLTNNRPSAILASYHLLIRKLTRPQKGLKSMQKLDTSEWNVHSKNTWRDKSITTRTQQQTEPANEKVSKHPSRPQKIQTQPTDCSAIRKRPESTVPPPKEPCPSLPTFPQLFPLSSPSLPIQHNSPTPLQHNGPTPLSAGGISDEEIAITLFPEVSVLQDMEVLHLSPPKSSASKLCDSAPCHAPATGQPTKDIQLRPVRPLHMLRTTHSDGTENDNHHDDHTQHRRGTNDRLEKLQTFYSSEAKGGVSISPRMLLEPPEPRSSDRENFSGAMEMAQTAPLPLPRLRNAGLKEEGGGRKVTWLGHMVQQSGPPCLLVNGSKPPAFAAQKQLVIKNLYQERSRRGGVALSGAGKRNSVQLRPSLQRRATDLNLPVLPAALQRPY
ncbi:hypothetical protein UPYG_G00248380 [Umbra pygmaea]|uniref:non-specific serine/threonine protein kinase n=1 Tax=Umbra pygmaea TaxID=75934 RepID=A0ABD0W722_UMBPY